MVTNHRFMHRSRLQFTIRDTIKFQYEKKTVKTNRKAKTCRGQKPNLAFPHFFQGTLAAQLAKSWTGSPQDP